ncbi:MAG: acyl-CoA thioesterase [Promethearchaeota archaeon]|jgi:acyl-CoA thioesterase FadM
MARIKIEIPSKFIYSTEIPIKITDINYGGHLGNDAVLSIIHEARVRFLNSLGFTELGVDGKGIMMVDAAVQYKHEGFYGDVLKIGLAIADITKIGFDFIYLLTNKETEKEIAIAKTGIVFYDYSNKKTVSVPLVFNEMIEGLR